MLRPIGREQDTKNIYLVYSTPLCCCNYLKKCTGGSRGPRGACGKLGHGKRVDGSSVRVCFACGRPKGDTTAPPFRPPETCWRWDVLGGADGFGTLCAGSLGSWTEFQYRKQY